MKILVSGATGLIGRALCQSLKRGGHTVIAASRAPERVRGLAADEIIKWDVMTSPPPPDSLEGTEAVIHLAGEPVAEKGWSVQQKQRIRDSRVVSTRNLIAGLRASQNRPQIFVCASAVGFYGERGDEKLDEQAAAGKGFLSEVCQDWEKEADAAEGLGIRLVKVRIGVVLSAEGGALKKMLLPFRLGIGGPLASGRQWFPWVHLDDIVGIFQHAIANPSVKGAFNGVAPEPVTNADFTKQLAQVLHRPAFVPTPEFALRLLFGERADVLLMSNRVIPQKALESGYPFHFPTLTPALEDLLG